MRAKRATFIKKRERQFSSTKGRVPGSIPIAVVFSYILGASPNIFRSLRSLDLIFDFLLLVLKN